MLRLLLLLQVLLSCLWLGHGEVFEDFASCPQFFYEGFTPSNVREPQNPAWICQRYHNQYHYATLYDKTLRIPVYSAYIYQPGSSSRSKAWFVEPQLIGKNNLKEMETELILIKQYKFISEQIKDSHPILQEYNNLIGLDRGHLNPDGHQNSFNELATFTLTNVVPQDSSLNKGAWNIHKFKAMAKTSKGCTTTCVTTGAVFGNTYITNGKVNVPSHIWAATCCMVGTCSSDLRHKDTGRASSCFAAHLRGELLGPSPLPLSCDSEGAADLSLTSSGRLWDQGTSACPEITMAGDTLTLIIDDPGQPALVDPAWPGVWTRRS